MYKDTQKRFVNPKSEKLFIHKKEPANPQVPF